MNKSHLMKTVCVVGISAACAWGLAGCLGVPKGEGDLGPDTVAATVDGVEIRERDVTSYLQNLRAQYNLTDDDAWGKNLAQQKTTPAELREKVIDSFVQRELIKAHAGERGASVSDDEINEVMEKTKQQYEGEDKWQAALEKSGWTEDDYREEIRLQLLDKKLKESFTSESEPSTEDLLQYAKMYASTYDGAKKSSHILFDKGDEATAQEVLDKLKDGSLDFAAAAKEYSRDTVSAQEGGDIGWDKTSQLVKEYTDGLKDLEKDQISGLVTSQFGIHIIKCTDVYTAPKTTAEDGTETVDITSPDQIPAEWLDSIKKQLNTQKQGEASQKWLDEQREKADIKINDMPEGLPYAVDMAKYKADEPADKPGEELGPDGKPDEKAEGADGSANKDAAAGDKPADAPEGKDAANDNANKPADAA